MKSQSKVVLCTEGCGGSCPSISINEEMELNKQVAIADDFGNTSYMSVKQFELFIQMGKDGELNQLF